MTKLTKKWYALHTKTRFENVVSESLLRKSIEVFLPKVKVRSKQRDRKKMIWVPIFSGYIFVRTDLDPREHLEILKTTGAFRLIGTGSTPVSIPSENIESLKIIVAGDKEVITGTQFKKGNKVMVTGGPFAGVTGTFVRYKGEGRVMVNIEALGLSAAVEVHEEEIQALPGILS